MAGAQAISSGAEKAVGGVPRGAGASGSRADSEALANPSSPTEGSSTTEPGMAMVPVEVAGLEQPAEPVGENWQPFTPLISRLPVELDVMVPVRNFRIRNLLSLEPAQIIESQWGHGDDLPVAAGDVTLAWSEFEVMDTQLAVRITRLS